MMIWQAFLYYDSGNVGAATGRTAVICKLALQERKAVPPITGIGNTKDSLLRPLGQDWLIIDLTRAIRPGKEEHMAYDEWKHEKLTVKVPQSKTIETAEDLARKNDDDFLSFLVEGGKDVRFELWESPPPTDNQLFGTTTVMPTYHSVQLSVAKARELAKWLLQQTESL